MQLSFLNYSFNMIIFKKNKPKHYRLYSMLAAGIIMLQSCAPKAIAQNAAIINGDDKSEAAIAFPSAEGFGKYTTGGRSGDVYIVANLNNDGEGSLRLGLKTKLPRIITFAITGNIHLTEPLNIPSNITLAGQTAPGYGICIADQPVILKGDNIIIRYLRFRMGDRYQNKGMVDGGGGDDALGGTKRKHIIIDHCSISWSTDEAFSIYNGDSTTLQWNLIAEPLNYSYHFETGDKDFENHGYGGILGGRHISIHHNLYAHCNSRTPRFDGNRNLKGDVENAEFTNNVIYNWGGNNVYGGEGGNYNIINNYYQPGPNTNAKVKSRICNPFKGTDIPFGKWYVAGNFVEMSPEVNKNNSIGVHMDKGNDADKKQALVANAFSFVPVTTQPAIDAYKSVTAKAGASLLRDTLDARIINDLKKGSGKIIDVQGGYSHGTAYEISRSAWPVFKQVAAPVDTDKDGIPDVWEDARGLNKADASDALKATLYKAFSNIEVYVNSLVK